MQEETEESDFGCTGTLGCLPARPALEHGLEGWVGFGNEGRALKALQEEETRAGVKHKGESRGQAGQSM